MKKFLKIVLILFIVAIVLLAGFYALVLNFGDKFLCSYADKLYKEKDFSTAYMIYDVINQYRPENADYKFKMTSCLAKMPLSYSVQKKLLETARQDDNSASEVLASKVLKRLRANIYKKTGRTYIKEALYNGIVLRWSKSSFPLTYCISPYPGMPEYYEKVTTMSFKDWERETDDFVTFKRVNNPGAAKIIVTFVGNADIAEKNTKVQYEAAVTKPLIEKEQILKQMRINSLVKNHNGEYFTPTQTKTIITHEIGHALGLWGHTKDNDTIMYYSLNNPYDYYENRIDTSLNHKDINTLKLLYALAPDITDNPQDLVSKEKFIYPDAVIGVLDNSKGAALAEATELLKEHPGDIGYALSLADAYSENGKFNQSINILNFLAANTTDRNLLSLLNYNIANNYISLKNYDKALASAKDAIKAVNNTENRTLVAYVNFMKGDSEEAEREFIKVLAKNPGYTNAAVGLADVYIKKKQYLKARAVLKELIKHNPNALNDKALNAYKLYTTL